MVPPPAGYDRVMRLTPWEEERLLIFSAAELARRHRAAGIALNAPEAIALMCDAMLEAARAGSGYAEVEAAGLAAVAPSEVMPGVRELIEDVRVEVLLGDGARLIVLVDPLGRGAPLDPDGPGAIVIGPRPKDEARIRRGTRAPPPDGDEHVAACDPGVIALPVRSGEPAPRVRSSAGGRLPPRPRGGIVRALGTRRDPDGDPRALRRPRRHGGVTRLSPGERRARFGPSAGDRIRLGDTTCGSASRRTARHWATSRSGATRRTSGSG